MYRHTTQGMFQTRKLRYVLGENLYKARMLTGLTQIEATSELKGIGNTTLSHWETNYCQPNMDQLVTLCKLYNTTPNEILGFEE